MEQTVQDTPEMEAAGCSETLVTFFQIHGITSQKTVFLGRGNTKETGNRNATAISENCYQSELNACYWTEQRKLRKRQWNFVEYFNFLTN
jgi:hypothetical protein